MSNNENESLADRLAREAYEVRQGQVEASRKLAEFIESSIDNVVPMVVQTITDGLKQVFDDVFPFEFLNAPHGSRWIKTAASSAKSGIRGAVIARITGCGPIAENKHDVNFTIVMDGELEIPGRPVVQFKAAAHADGSPRPNPSADFIAATFETRLRQMLNG